MEQDGQHLGALRRVAQLALPGAGLAFDDRVDRLEMAWVGREADADLQRPVEVVTTDS